MKWLVGLACVGILLMGSGIFYYLAIYSPAREQSHAEDKYRQLCVEENQDKIQSITSLLTNATMASCNMGNSCKSEEVLDAFDIEFSTRVRRDLSEQGKRSDIETCIGKYLDQ